MTVEEAHERRATGLTWKGRPVLAITRRELEDWAFADQTSPDGPGRRAYWVTTGFTSGVLLAGDELIEVAR